MTSPYSAKDSLYLKNEFMNNIQETISCLLVFLYAMIQPRSLSVDIRF